MLGRFRVPVFGGVIAVVLGIAVMLFGSGATDPASGLMTTALVLFVLYFLAGNVMGLMWPGPSWAWGAWVALPFVLLILLSVAFAGQIGAFFRHDLVPLGGAVGGGLMGGTIGSTVRGRFARPEGRTGA